MATPWADNGMKAKPNLADVLAAVVPGRVTYLNLSEEQKGASRDADGQIGLEVTRHHHAARAASLRPTTQPDSFPLTEAVFQAVAAKRGHTVGIKRSRRIIRRLVAVRVINCSGSHRQPYRNTAGGNGFRVVLYTLGVAIRALVAPLIRRHPARRVRAAACTPRGNYARRSERLNHQNTVAAEPGPAH